MQTDELKQLIEKFFDGETSVEEERRLKEYFRREDVPEQFADVKVYFKALDQEVGPALDEDFDKHLFEKMAEKDIRSHMDSKRWIYRIVAAAAVVLLMVWVGTKVFGTKEEYGTVNDPVLAFNETRKALDLAAAEMNRGLTPTEKTVKTVDESLQKVYQLGKWEEALKKTEKLFQSTNNIISKGKS